MTEWCSHIGVGSNVVCSTTIGNARALVRGTGNKSVPTLFVFGKVAVNPKKDMDKRKCL